MSVMWGLTGNMDPRLVSDGKALDVAYDAGAGNPKRTAEVTLSGEGETERMCINNFYFYNSRPSIQFDKYFFILCFN